MFKLTKFQWFFSILSLLILIWWVVASRNRDYTWTYEGQWYLYGLLLSLALLGYGTWRDKRDKRLGIRR